MKAAQDKIFTPLNVGFCGLIAHTTQEISRTNKNHHSPNRCLNNKTCVCLSFKRVNCLTYGSFIQRMSKAFWAKNADVSAWLTVKPSRNPPPPDPQSLSVNG